MHVKKEIIDNIKKLRNQTGASIKACKASLQASENNFDIAITILQKKGLIFANKKLNRPVIEGLIQSYIHTNFRIGIIVELNCETDFVAKQLKFHQLAKDIAMQIAVYKSVEYISEDKSFNSEQNHLFNEWFNIQYKTIENSNELFLMNQIFIKNQEITIEELVKQHIVFFGENIKIKRFVRFILGED
uniref:Elongation factor Ts, mitochondrial n=1 Tax=Harveyella mirabilis TaxID=282355 RepID=A0A3S8UW07_9FLOR|nr:translation elongation factor Ts [Harveyella mirabilis]